MRRPYFLLPTIVLSAIESSNAFSSFRTHQNLLPKRQLHVRSMKDANSRSETEAIALNDRRETIKKLFSTTMMASGMAYILGSGSKPTNAACLPGDVSPDCIGVYKLPLDDAVTSYIDTPEHLAKHAPDMRWVPLTEYPKSVSHRSTTYIFSSCS